MWYYDEDIEKLKALLGKSVWTKKEAVLILAGILPDDKYAPYLWVPELYYCDRFVACQYKNEYDHTIAESEILINDALCIVENLSMRNEKNYEQERPIFWLQLFCDEGILNDPVIYNVLSEAGIILQPQNDSRIAKYYMTWASKERWSFHNTVALLCRKSTDDTDCGLGGFTYDPFGYSGCDLSRSAFYGKHSVEDVMAKLRDTIASKGIEFIEVDRFSHIERRIKPSDAVKWAELKGYNYPKLLMEALGFEAPKNQSAVTAKSEEQFKQWFKALVKEKPEPEKTKPQYQEDAIKNFRGLSVRGFLRVWNELTVGTAYAEKGRCTKK